ncbi:MAG: GxxExxY protein [Planctomycetota bacterium]
MERKELNPDLESLVTRVIGAAIEVHQFIGPGFPEAVYQNALSHELDLQEITHRIEYPVQVVYKDKRVGEGRIDILVEDQLVLELKTVNEINDVHRAQVTAYLKAMNLEIGFVLNFNTAVLKDGIKRVIN